MDLVRKIDDYGKPAWIGLMVVGFLVFWPAGLAVLAYLIWSGRLTKADIPDSATSLKAQGCAWARRMREPASSGNAAFDAYRAETLRRLEEERREFDAFVSRLRKARDQSEFDQFMAERKTGKQPDA